MSTRCAAVVRPRAVWAFALLAGLWSPNPTGAAGVSAGLSVTVVPAVVSSGGAVAAVTLTNGPPNLSNALMGAGAPSGSHVSLVYADMVPMSTNFTGQFSLSGADASHFLITTSSDGTRSVGEIKTNGSLGAGDYGINVSASGASQNVTVHVIDGTRVGCNSAIPTSGVVVLSANCTYHWDSVQGGKDGDGYVAPSSNTIFVGVGNGSTIIDGGGNSSGHCGALRTDNNGATNITVAGIQWQNFGCPTYTDAGTLLLVSGAIRNNRFFSNGNILPAGASTITNNLFDHSARNTIGGNPGTIPSGSTMTMNGNEFTANALTMPGSECGNLANIKLLTVSNTNVTANFVNNYVHDNNYFTIWYDTDIQPSVHHFLTGNTFVHNSGPAMEFENSDDMDVGFNVFIDNGGAGFGTAPTCPGSGTWAGLEGVSGNTWNVHDNNFSQQTQSGGNEEKVFSYHQDGRGQGDTGIVFQNNTVTFKTTGSNARVENDTPASGSKLDGNRYWMSNTGDTHFVWGGFTGSFSGLQGQGQEAHGSVQVGDEQAMDHVTGCRHLACSGAGIGQSGNPL